MLLGYVSLHFTVMLGGNAGVIHDIGTGVTSDTFSW